MIKRHTLQTQGILLGLFAMLVFSTNDGAFKHAMQTSSMNVVVFIGYFFSSLFLFAYAFTKKIPLLPNSKRNGVCVGGLFLIEQITFVYALKYIPIAELFIVVLASPVSVTIMSSVFLKEHLKPREILAVAFGFTGALLIVSWPLLFSDSSGKGAIPELAWISACLNVFLNSSKIIYLRKYCREESTVSLSICTNLFVVIYFGLQLFSLPSFAISLLDVGLLLVTGILAGFGYILYVRAFQLTIAPLVSATQYSQILWATLMGVFIFHEKITPPAIAGMALILLSGYLLYFRKKDAEMPASELPRA